MPENALLRGAVRLGASLRPRLLSAFLPIIEAAFLGQICFDQLPEEHRIAEWFYSRASSREFPDPLIPNHPRRRNLGLRAAGALPNVRPVARPTKNPNIAFEFQMVILRTPSRPADLLAHRFVSFPGFVLK